MSAEPELVEFDVPDCAGLSANVAAILPFDACFTQWIDGESMKRLAPTSKQVIAHRLLSALGGSSVVWLRKDWQLVCELLEDSEVDLVPPLTATNTETQEAQELPAPPFLVRRYLGAILNARPTVVLLANAAE